MRQWNEHGAGVGLPVVANGFMSDDEPQRGVVGGGVARILGLCEALKMADCQSPPAATAAEDAAPVDTDLTDLARTELGPETAPASVLPRIDLLGATAGGAPNVVPLEGAAVVPQGIKELDDNYVA